VSRESTAAIILAGGLSTRLGRDKASELLLGHSLLQRVIDRLDGLVDEYVVVMAQSQTLPSLEVSRPLRTVEDAYPHVGPLGGVYSGLSAMAEARAITVACDMPLLQPALISELLRLLPGHDAVVPLNPRPEPLCAAYSVTCLPAILGRINEGSYRVTGFFEAIDVLYLEPEIWRPFDPQGLSFLNVNREEDLRRAEQMIASESQ
jgi:molybdopterin-guanine dinucleotide biosynthesis protein A